VTRCARNRRVRPRRLVHAVQGFPHIGGNAERQSCDHSAAGENFRIGSQHHRRHGAAGGKAGDEDAARIDAGLAGDPRDHLADRSGFAAIARDIFRIEPVEAALRIVRCLLFRHQQRETIALGHRRPAGAEIVAGRGLAAAVQDDDQSRRRGEVFGQIGEHPEIAGIGAKPGDFHQRAADARPRASPQTSQAIEPVELWQAAQEFDIVGEGHGSSLVRDL
jgi:hypothetical protein